MSPASRSKSKDKAGKEPTKAASKPASANAGAGISTSGYNPLLGTFHTLHLAPANSNTALHVNSRFRNIDETDDDNGHTLGSGPEYDSVSNNGSCSGESEDHKEKISSPPSRPEAVPGADNDKREKIRQKNERKHQRQKERRAQELHEKCTGYLMSRKLEALAQQLVAMGFSSERATMALIQNEGKVAESVSWLFEGGEETDKRKEQIIDVGGNLKIDITEELAQIAELENKYKCTKQEVERAVVACEGDLDKAEECLRLQKQGPQSMSPNTEGTGDPPIVANGNLPTATRQNPIRAPVKPSSSSTTPSKRDEKEFSYTKVAATAGSCVDPGSKNIQSLKKVHPKLEGDKPQMAGTVDKRWLNAGSEPSVSYSLASSLPASPLPNKTEACYLAFGNKLKNLQLGTMREPVILMQRPQSINSKPNPPSTGSSSPPGTAAGWYGSNNVKTMKPNGQTSHIAVTRNQSTSSVSANQFYSQLHHEQQQLLQHCVSSNGSAEPPGTCRGNSLWSRTGASQTQTPTLAVASSLGLFSGLGTNDMSGSLSHVDWNTGGGSMLQLDYTNIDWSLDYGSLPSRTGGMWPTLTSFLQNGARTYDSFTPGLGFKTSMRPFLSNGSGISIPGLQDGVAKAETFGGSREWTSPFEERDLFSLPRLFVTSPSQ